MSRLPTLAYSTAPRCNQGVTSLRQVAEGQDGDVLGQGIGAWAGIDDDQVVEAQFIQRDAQ